MKTDSKLFNFYKASSYLGTFVDCIYQIKDNISELVPKEHFAYPDGYPEIVINLGGSYSRMDMLTGKTELVPHGSCIIIGQKTRTIRIHQEEKCDIISLKLKPYGLHQLLGASPSHISNKITFANAVWGKELEELIHILCQVEDDVSRVYVVQKFFESRHLIKKHDLVTTEIIDYINHCKGVLRIGYICDRFGITPRTLENRFKGQIGISPKKFCAIIQFNNFLVNSFNHTGTLTGAAIDSGYYDQAHFNRKFKSITNSNPKKQLVKRNLLNTINLEILHRQLNGHIHAYDLCVD